MNHFQYIDGVLHAENVPLADIAEAVGTPFYCYSTATLERHYKVFAEAFAGHDALICYAVKANGNLSVIRTLADLGAGADVVSEGELRKALAGGVPAERIIFSGVGKTRAEMAVALDCGVMQLNVESIPELEALSAIAAGRGMTADIGIRINPNVDARTHEKISTGKAENKFGIAAAAAPEAFARAEALPGVRPVSVAVHIGSQLSDLEPFRAAFTTLATLVRELRAHGHEIRRVDLGGGLGIPYRDETPPLPVEYAAMVNDTVGDLGCQLVFEPGRMLVGNAGVLVSRVVYVKEGEAKRFVIVDAAMNDLLRPAMYDAWHEIKPLNAPPQDAPVAPVDVVGPACETSDTFARQRNLTPIREGDLLAILTAGAYGAVMASTYNMRLLTPEILVRGSQWSVVRARPSYEDLLRQDSLAKWQDKPK
ncbi:MAG: diaminopimelate decarboxylase [Alphaproteobacteria bacterium]|nr:diaminopimelate decarboxylase [Alphaproteobacteria bacterium]